MLLKSKVNFYSNDEGGIMMVMAKRAGLFLSLSIAVLMGYSQRYKTVESHIQFYSDAPMEDIFAVNEMASSIIDVETMTIAIVVPIQGFQFKKKLMQTHFNENYLESDKYPKATFKGKIENWDRRSNDSTATAKGTLEIHGVEREVAIDGIVMEEGENLLLKTSFPIKLEDYKVKIPKAVFYKIAEVVEVTATLEYTPYEKN